MQGGIVTATRRGPSMHDVAALAGVSHQTVSRVINGSSNLRPETRDRVQAAIDELGYRRNMAARALVTGRTHSIGVLTPGEPNLGKMRSVHAVEQSARDAGYFPLVTSAAADSESIGKALDFLMDRSIEGLVVIAPHASVLDQVAKLDVDFPVVTLQTGGYDETHAVAVDQASGVEAAVAHLVAMGHNRIQHVAGPSDYFEAQLRRDAFEAAVVEHGLEVFPVPTGDWSVGSGYECGKLIAPEATAVFCANDQMALGLIHALVSAGRRVPDDVSVIGFDDIPEAAHSLPPLTTVHQDFEAVGRTAVAHILTQIRDAPIEPLPASTPWLVERESVRRV